MATTKADILFLRWEGEDANASVPADLANGGLNEDGVNGSTETSTSVLDSGSGSGLAQALAPVNEALASLAVDPATQKYFYVDQDGYSVNATAADNAVIYAGSTVTGLPAGSSGTTRTGTPAPTPLHSVLTPAEVTTQVGQENYLSTINDIVVAPGTTTLYFSQTLEDGNNNYSAVAAQTGIFSMSESGGAVTPVLTGLANPDVIALDLSQGLIFFTDSTGDEAFQGGDGQNGEPGPSVNNIDVYNVNTRTTTVLLSETYHPDGTIAGQGYGGNTLDGLAVDPATQTLYYTTNNVLNNLTTDAYADTQNAIYKVAYAINGSSVALLSGSTTTLYSGANAFDPSRIALDLANGVFYVNGNLQEFVPSTGSSVFPYDDGVYEGSLTANNTTALTRVTPVTETTGTSDQDGSTPHLGEYLGVTAASQGTPGDGNVIVDDVPALTAGASVKWVAGAGAVQTDAALTATSGTATDFISGSVTIAGAEAGDVLATTKTGTAITVAYNASTFTLTLSGTDTKANYQQVLDSVTYNNTSANPTNSGASTSRTLTYAVSDGLLSGAATSTVTLEVPPAVTPGAPGTTFTGGGAAVAADPVLTVTDYTASTLTGATVSLSSGFLAGDTLSFTAQNGIAAAYNGTTGVLALTGSATVAQYQAALRSVTFGFSPSNGNPAAGGDTSRTLSYTVTDGTLSSSVVTSTIAVSHAVPTVMAGTAGTFTRGSTLAVVVDSAASATAPDSGGNLASATVTITNLATGDTLAGTTVSGVTTSYNATTGVLSFTGTATVAQYQTLLDSVTFTTGNAAAIGTRTLSYVVNDGTANSAAASSTVTVLVPTPTITGTSANRAVADNATVSPFSGVTVGDATGESDSATITVKAGTTASDVDGTLSGTGLTKTGTGTYTVAAGTPMALSSEVDALVFTPTAHQVAPGSTVTTGFTVAVTDTGGGSVTNTATTVVATASTDAPTITGTMAGQATTDQVPVQPFASVTIGDVDTGTMPTVTITVRNGGTATDADGLLSGGTGFSKTGTGTYALSEASPATLSSEIDALTFTPTRDEVPVGQAVTDEFDITAAFGGMSATNTATTVASTDVPCFCAGTRIQTERGEVAVETLVVGDRVCTAAGEVRPITWIGWRRYAGRFLRSNPAVQPVCIRAGALEPGVPARDLRVSPLHALFIDGVLIPAGVLVNGGKIARETVDAVNYFHVELDSHDVLFAEGAPAESFLDDGSAGMFHNVATRPVRQGVDAFCAPRAVSGYAVEAVRHRLADRARHAA